MRILAFALAFSCLALAQPKLAFEVVAIRPVPPLTPETVRAGANVGMKVDGTHVQIGAYSPVSLLSAAFRVSSQQVVAPDFTRGQYFDIQATIPQGGTPDQVPEMLQAMLAERFRLTFHHEMRDYPISSLTVGKSGMKLPRLPDDTQPTSGSTRLPDGGSRMTVVGKVTSLFPVMNSFGGLQMVDETGLDGVYTWVSDMTGRTPGASYQDMVQESFKNMIEAAGLKLETRKVSKDSIVVDHIEKAPTEN